MYTQAPYSKKHMSTSQAGFSLIEVLVSMALFATVVTMGVGTLLVLIDANTKQQSAQAVVTNMSFALDSMTREIRTGFFYQCTAGSGELTLTNLASGQDVTTDCPSGASNFAFTESGTSLTGGLSSNRIAYRYNPVDKSIERNLGNTGWRPVTASNVTVETFRFIVTGAESYEKNGNTNAPIVTIFVSGFAGDVAGIDTSFELQTTVTQQVLDI